MSRTHAEVIEEHRIKIGAISFHADYNPDCDPEELAKALDSVLTTSVAYAALDPIDVLEHTVEHYENIFRQIREMTRIDVREWLNNPDDPLYKFKSELHSLVDMGIMTSMEGAIEFAEKKNASGRP
jgi:hypothetical protein